MKKYLPMLLLVTSPAWSAGNWGPMSGELAISHSPLSDSNPKNPLVAYVVIKGDAAKKIYESMKNVKTFRNACGVVGLVQKFSGNLTCSNMEKEYNCNFGVNLQNGKSEFGYSC